MFGADMIFRIPALLIALTVHEYAHARAAVAMGDPTPKHMGRLTLNPIAHLDPIGLIMLWVFKFGWAKPVPINPNNFRDGRKGMIIVSFAGPGANILTAFIAAFILGFLAKFNILPDILANILRITVGYNVLFAIFNLVPIPPLDGSKILISLLPGPQAYAFQRLEQYGPFILMGLVYTGVVGAITYPLERALVFLINTFIFLVF